MPTSMFGGFSDPPFISTDSDPKKTDAYVKSEVIPSRYTGANFKVGRPKKGRGKDAYFGGDHPSLAVATQTKAGKADDYLDAGVLERRQAKEQKKKNIDPNRDFKFASPPKRSTGAGSHFGTFDGKPIPHAEEYKVQKRGEPTPKKEVKAPKNILTSPAKKGTYGYLGTTFSKIEGTKEGAADEFDALRKRELAEWKKSKEKMISTTVFRNTIRPVRSFDEKGATGVSNVYDHYDPPEEKKSKGRKPKKPEEKKIDDRPVFRYSSGRRSGADGCLNKFANTRDDKPDPYDAAAIKAKEDKKKSPGFIGGTWKPVHAAKKPVVRSLLKTYY